MVGGAIVRALRNRGYEHIVTRTHADLALDDRDAVRAFFDSERPDWVFLAAAKVGGIVANDTLAGDFIRENLLIQTHVIDAAQRSGTRRFLFLGSSCIYPKFAEQPIREDSLLTGKLEPTNSAYAIAKIAGVEMCDAYRRQFGFDAFTVMPSNVYGLGDNFHPDNSHVAAGLMRRFDAAVRDEAPEVVVWGSGTPLRELIFSEDLGDACVFLMERYRDGGMINAGSGEEVTIADLARMIAAVTGYAGRIVFDAGKPDGTPRKVMDSSRLRALGWAPRTGLAEGLEQMYRAYRESRAA